MVTLARVLVVVAVSSVLMTGCKKEEEAPQAVPLPSAAPAPVQAKEEAPQPVQTAQPAEGSAAGSAAAPADTAAAAATTAPKPVAQASIDGCCSALAAMAKSGLPGNVKAKAASASAMCAGTSKLVKEGKASRSGALTQIKATMGGNAPAECK